MLNKLKIFFRIMVVVLLFSMPVSASINFGNQDTEREKAILLFNSGEFEKASSIFEKLITETPEDEMLNYYYGACLAEQDIFTDQTNQYLLKAVSGNTPDKIFYYVGKYFQSRELWNSALKYYNRFNSFGTEKDKASVEIDKLIKFCNDKISPPSVDSTSLTTITSDTLIELSTTEISTRISMDIINKKEDSSENFESEIIIDNITEVEEITETKEIEEFEPINFQVSSDIEYLKTEHFKNTNALTFFNEGVEAKIRLKEIISESDSLRKLYSISTGNRNSISERILTLEQETYSLNSQASLAFNKARELEQTYWNNVKQEEIKNFRKEINDLKNQLILNDKEPKELETTLIVVEPEIFIQENQSEIIQKEEPETDEIKFKIQVGAYSRSLPDYINRLYKKLSLIRVIDNYTDDRGVTVYTTGNLTNFEDAVRLQAQVRQEGVKDAFVVAYKNGKRIKLSEAKKILNIK
ncbi:MAG: hypothetical protein HQ541_17575 [Mariniphaga sp.]|nr:hypothetical protein [Mariniphaga sp.]